MWGESLGRGNCDISISTAKLDQQTERKMLNAFEKDPLNQSIEESLDH